MNEQNKLVEGISSAPMYPSIHQMKHLNSTHSIETILVVFALLNGLNKLWVSIGKICKDHKIDITLLLQTVAAIGAILKAFSQIAADRIDSSSEEPHQGDEDE